MYDITNISKHNFLDLLEESLTNFKKENSLYFPTLILIFRKSLSFYPNPLLTKDIISFMDREKEMIRSIRYVPHTVQFDDIISWYRDVKIANILR